jgi:hypothetical protein
MDTWSINTPPEAPGDPRSTSARSSGNSSTSRTRSSPRTRSRHLPAVRRRRPVPDDRLHPRRRVCSAKSATPDAAGARGHNRGYAVSRWSTAWRPAQFVRAVRRQAASASARQRSKYLLDETASVLGDSAGCYYAVMAAATQGNPALEDLSMAIPRIPAASAPSSAVRRLRYRHAGQGGGAIRHTRPQSAGYR